MILIKKVKTFNMRLYFLNLERNNNKFNYFLIIYKQQLKLYKFF